MYLDITIKRSSVEKQQIYERLYQSTRRRKNKGENLDKSFSIRRLSKRLNRSCVVGKHNKVSLIFEHLDFGIIYDVLSNPYPFFNQQIDSNAK